MSLSDSDFCELMECAQNGDECARTFLAKDAEKVISREVKKIMPKTENVEDVKDVTQECLARIFDFQTLRRFRTRRNYEAWKGFLRREAFFRVNDHWRKKERTPKHASLDNNEDTDTLERLSETEAAESRAKDNVRNRHAEVIDIIRKTGSKRNQEIALLCWREDLSHLEIAEMYNISTTFVSTIISRIKKGVEDKFNYCILLPSWMRDIMERIADGLLLHSKQVGLWIVPQLSCLFLSSIILLLAEIEQGATVLPPHRKYAPDWATGVQFYPLIAKKPPLKVSQVNQSSGGESSDSAQNPAADSRNDIESDKDSWTQTKGPYGGTITTLHATPEGVLFSGTLSGYIFRSADGGETWMPASEGLLGNYNRSLAPVRSFVQNGNTLYADTDRGYFYSINGGDLWQQLTYQDGGRISEIATIGNTIYIRRIGQEGVFFSNDNGKSWTQIDNGLTDQGAPTLFTSGTTLFAQMRHHVFRLKAGENAWTKLIIKDSSKKTAVESDITKFVVSGEIVYAVTVDGGLFRSTDMGDWWHAIKPETMQSFDGEMAVVQNTVFCIDSSSGGGRVFRSVDAGDSWTMFNTNLTNQKLLSITILSKKMLYVGTCNGVFRSTDGGESWTKASTGIITRSGDLVSFRNALYTVAGDGIFKSVDGGDSWMLVNDGLIANGGAKMAGGGGIIVWFGVKLAVSGGKLYAATCKSDSSYWNPDTSGIYYLAEDEKSWMPIHTNMPSSIGKLDRLLVSGETFYVVGHGRLYRWRVGEDRWADLGLRVLDEEGLAVSGRTVYVAREDGKLLHSGDEGDTWTDVSQRLPNWNLQSKRNYKQFIYDLHFIDETIYAGSDYGILRSTDGNEFKTYDGFYRIFRSTDGGETWESVVDGLPSGNFNIQTVHGAMLYGENDHGIFHLRHGADSWERSTQIQHTVRSLAFDGTTFYASTRSEGIFRFSLDE